MNSGNFIIVNVNDNDLSGFLECHKAETHPSSCVCERVRGRGRGGGIG